MPYQKSILTIAEAQIKVRQAQIDALKGQIIQSEADMETARVNLGYPRVTAPFEGTVLATVVQEEQKCQCGAVSTDHPYSR